MDLVARLGRDIVVEVCQYILPSSVDQAMLKQTCKSINSVLTLDLRRASKIRTASPITQPLSEEACRVHLPPITGREALKLAASAAECGMFNNLKYLIDAHSPLNVNDLFVHAATSGRIDILDYLVQAGASPETFHKMALAFAAENGHLEATQWLFAYHYGNLAHYHEALVTACDNGHLTIAQWLVEQGVNPLSPNACDALPAACGSGHLEVVKWLITGQGLASLSALNFGIVEASRHGHLDTIKYLVARGAQVQALDNEAIVLACRGGHLETVKWLISQGVNVASVQFGRALDEASCNGHLNLLQWLVANGTAMSPEDASRCLAAAASAGQLHVAEWLVGERGANTTHDGNYALLMAVAGNQRDTARWLIDHGARIDVNGILIGMARTASDFEMVALLQEWSDNRLRQMQNIGSDF